MLKNWYSGELKQIGFRILVWLLRNFVEIVNETYCMEPLFVLE